MDNFVFILWEDAKVDSNKVYGCVELDAHDLARLVAQKYESQTGNKVAHSELRGLLTCKEDFSTNLPSLNIDLDRDEVL